MRCLIHGQPLTAGVFGKLDFRLVVQLPCHFSIIQNVLTLISTRFMIDTADHTNTNNQFSLMKGFKWHKPVEA